MSLSRALSTIGAACESVGAFLRGVRGWKRLVIAFAAGALSAPAFAPFGLFPLLLLGFAVLVLLLDGAQAEAHPIRRSAAIGQR